MPHSCSILRQESLVTVALGYMITAYTGVRIRRRWFCHHFSQRAQACCKLEDMVCAFPEINGVQDLPVRLKTVAAVDRSASHGSPKYTVLLPVTAFRTQRGTILIDRTQAATVMCADGPWRVRGRSFAVNGHA